MDYPVHAIFVLVYLLALIGLGAMKAGKIKTQEDFSLAGRNLTTWVLVGTLLATWIGTGSIFGNAQKTFETGVGAFILPVGSLVGILILSRLAGRIRNLEQVTLQDILERRFGVATRIIGLIALMLAYVIIVSYQYRAGAAVLEYLFKDSATGQSSLSHTSAVLIVAGFVIAYTALAGMVSVAYTDVANGILMTLGVLIALPILYQAAGGWDGALAKMPEAHQTTAQAWTPTNLINWLMPAFLLMLGDANMYQRFFSAKDGGTARRAAFWLILGIAVLETAIIAVAFFGRAIYDNGGLTLVGEDGGNPAHVVVAIAFQDKLLPPFLGAMLMATIVAIIVSTADSFLLAPSTSFVRDVWKRFYRPNAGNKEVVLLGRIIVVLFGISALGLAFTSKKFFEVALFAYTVYGASITPVMIAAFFWPRATKAGATASMLAGLVTALGWSYVQMKGWWKSEFGWESIQSVNAVLPALLIAVVVLVVVSLMTPPPDEEQVRSV